MGIADCRFPIAHWRRAGAALVAAGLLWGAAGVVHADEPGVLSKERWAELTEVQFAELKGAEDLYRKKKWTAARNAYEKFMTVHSKSDVATYCQLMMAECMRLSGKPNLAVSDFQFVRDLAPESDDAKWAHLRIAQCHRQAGDVEKALVVLGDIWKEAGSHPTAFWAAVEQVGILTGQQKWKERVPVWEGLVERFAKNRVDREEFSRAATGLAREKVATGDADGGYKLLAMLHKAEEAQTRLIEMGRSVVGDLNKNKENHPQRDKVANGIVNRAANWLKEDKDRHGHQDMVHAMVWILADCGMGEEAVKQAQGARKLYGEAKWTVELAAALFTKLEKPDAAIGVASEARRVHKDADWTLDLYATLVLAKGDMEGALAAWDLMKDKKASLTRTSEVLAKVGKLKEAIERRRRIVEEDAKEASNVFMWVGELLQRNKKFDEAIKEYQQASTEPTNLYRIAECLSQWGKHKESIGKYEEIGAAFENERPHAIYCMALEYEKLNQKETAINLLRRVCRTYPKAKAASSAHVRLQSKYGIDETLGGSEGDQKVE